VSRTHRTAGFSPAGGLAVYRAAVMSILPRGTLAALAALTTLGAALPAEAHQTSVKYVDVTIDGERATIEMTVAPGDVTEPLGLAADAQPAVAEALTPGVAAYVARWIEVTDAGGAPCTRSAAQARADGDRRFVVVAWQASCGDLARIALDFGAFFAVDPRHEAIVRVREPGATGDAAVVRASDPILRIRAGEPTGLGGWIASGVEHIWDGRDHVSFVLALLLVMVLIRDRQSWAARPPLATLRHAAAIITAFTIAHSLSLIAASLGWISLPGRLVEAVIAFSILYTAVENILRPDVRWRFALTFGFGLVHGLGFASVLAELLPPGDVLGPLLGFNLGVELGQLAIVVVALPLFWLLARVQGAERYRRHTMPALSIVIGAVAIKWLVERVFDLTLPTFLGM
jgi:hypothetical protein